MPNSDSAATSGTSCPLGKRRIKNQNLVFCLFGFQRQTSLTQKMASVNLIQKRGTLLPLFEPRLCSSFQQLASTQLKFPTLLQGSACCCNWIHDVTPHYVSFPGSSPPPQPFQEEPFGQNGIFPPPCAGDVTNGHKNISVRQWTLPHHCLWPDIPWFVNSWTFPAFSHSPKIIPS